MTDPVISPDGKWMWTGSEWIPAPPTLAPVAYSDINSIQTQMNQEVLENNSRDAARTDAFDFKIFISDITYLQTVRDWGQILLLYLTVYSSFSYWYDLRPISHCIMIVLFASIAHSVLLAETGSGYKRVAYFKMSFLLEMLIPLHISLFISFILADIVTIEFLNLPSSFLVYFLGTFLIFLPFSYIFIQGPKSRFKEYPERCLRPGF
jgi:hypothetical protein